MIRPNRYDLCRIDIIVCDVIVTLDMIEVHGFRNPFLLKQILEIPEQVRIVDDPPDVALEVTVIYRVEPNQRREQVPIGLRDLIPH